MGRGRSRRGRARARPILEAKALGVGWRNTSELRSDSPARGMMGRDRSRDRSILEAIAPRAA